MQIEDGKFILRRYMLLQNVYKMITEIFLGLYQKMELELKMKNASKMQII